MSDLYGNDILLWSEQQASLLRRLARGERVNGVDWENVVEEVEGVGRSEFRAAESLLSVALRHILLAHGAPRPEPVPHWTAEAIVALRDARKHVSPSMGPRLDIQEIWDGAREFAARKLLAEGGAARALPEVCPFPLAVLMDPRVGVDDLLGRLAAAET